MRALARRRARRRFGVVAALVVAAPDAGSFVERLVFVTVATGSTSAMTVASVDGLASSGLIGWTMDSRGVVLRTEQGHLVYALNGQSVAWPGGHDVIATVVGADQIVLAPEGPRPDPGDGRTQWPGRALLPRGSTADGVSVDGYTDARVLARR